MEDLLIEMRHEQDVKLKRITGLQKQLDTLTEQVNVISTKIRRLSDRRKKTGSPISN
jgi:predicted  nucleic acid-binding Zn-ribbon protein